MVLGLEFPPVSHLVNWQEIWFKGTPCAFTKVTLIYVLAVILTMGFFLLAGRKKRARAVGHAEHRGVGARLHPRERDHADDGEPRASAGCRSSRRCSSSSSSCNIFEIIPVFQMPGNARIAVPLILAVTVWVIFNFVGIKAQGFGPLHQELAVSRRACPKAMLILVVPIEFVSMFLVRPFSLAVRLFANMLAGHFILVTFALLTASLWSADLRSARSCPFGLLVALTGFEVLVAVLQAFIFTILTAVYIGGSMSPEH